MGDFACGVLASPDVGRRTVAESARRPGRSTVVEEVAGCALVAAADSRRACSTVCLDNCIVDVNAPKGTAVTAADAGAVIAAVGDNGATKNLLGFN